MWEAIVVLAKTPAAIALVVGLFGLLFYMVRKGILSFKGHGVSLGTADSEAKIRNMQQLYAKALFEGTISDLPKECEYYHKRFVISQCLDEVERMIRENHITDDDLRDEMALCMQLKPVNVLPTGADITTDMYYCNGTYYVGQVDESDPTQSICVPLDTAVVSNTVAEDNMGAVTSNAVWEWSRYENAVRLNFYAEGTTGMASGQGIEIPSTYDTTDKQIEYMLNYVRDISIAKDKPLVYCGMCTPANAPNTTSVACPSVYTFQIVTVKGTTNYWARAQFIASSAGGYSNAVAGISQTGGFHILRQCNVSVNNTLVVNNITITAAAPTSTYTADRDGEVWVHVTNQSGGYTPSLVINGVVVDTCPFHRAGACTLRGRISKGDTYQVITDCPSGVTIMFINAMGIQGINHWTSRAASW